MKFTAGPIIRRTGFRPALIGNGMICALIMTSYTLFRPWTPHAVIVMTLLIGGFFRSLQFTALNALAYADIPQSSMSNASSLSSMAQQLFLSFGVALSALLLHLSLGGRGVNTLSTGDFTSAFVITAALAAVSALFFLLLEPDAGAEVSGHETRVAVSSRAEPAPQVD
jgi:sugar phosphate permease